MKNTISKFDFFFNQIGTMHYDVKYTCPETMIYWRALITDIEMIKRVKDIETPKVKHMKKLKNYCVKHFFVTCARNR